MKIYSKTSNAKRAAENAECTGYTLVQQENGGWMIVAYDGASHNNGARIEAAPPPATAAAKTSGATDMHVPSHPTAAELDEAKRIFAIPRPQKRHLAALAAARTGRLPEAPNFSAATHAPYRKRLAAIKAGITTQVVRITVLFVLRKPCIDGSAERHRTTVGGPVTTRRVLARFPPLGGRYIEADRREITNRQCVATAGK